MRVDVPHLASEHAAPPRSDLAQMLVPPAMLVASVAMGIAGYLHLGVSAEVATAVGVSLFCLMLMCHVLLRVADEAERAAEEAAERGVEQVASPMPHAPEPGEGLVAAMAAPARELLSPGATVPAAVTPEPAVEPMTKPAAWSFRPVDLDQPRLQATEGPDAVRELPELGALRPNDARHELVIEEAYAGAPSPAGREADRVDAILKRLARQIQSGSAAVQAQGAAAERSAGQGMAGDASSASGPAATLGAPQPGFEELAAANPDSALSSAVDALRSTVEAMRGTGEPAAHDVSPAELRVAAIAEAIQAERADVFLAPILGLADDTARHFEVFVQLRVEQPSEARGVAAGAGLLPLLDALNVRHAAGFALMLERRGRDGVVFSRVGGGSLQNDQFVSDVSGRHAQGIADRMVLTFDQHELRGLGPAQITALGDLGRLGFRFAMQGVADLDMDFEALQALGFEFAKLDAAVFAAGLTCGGEHVPATDICRNFEEIGLEVIVSGIGDAATRELMMSCGVAYGQGTLFGDPRPVPVAGATGTMAA